MTKKSGISSRRKRSLTSNSLKETGYPQVKSNRRKKQQKLIQQNPRYTFFIGADGVCYYEKKKAKRNE